MDGLAASARCSTAKPRRAGIDRPALRDEGVRDTQTHIAFRTYSSADLDAAFALGLDGA